MKANLYDLLRTQGARLQGDPLPAVDPKMPELNPKRPLIGTGFPRHVLMENGYTKKELKAAEKDGVKKTYVNVAGVVQAFYYVPAEPGATIDEASTPQGSSD